MPKTGRADAPDTHLGTHSARDPPTCDVGAPAYGVEHMFGHFGDEVERSWAMKSCLQYSESESWRWTDCHSRPSSSSDTGWPCSIDRKSTRLNSSHVAISY